MALSRGDRPPVTLAALSVLIAVSSQRCRAATRYCVILHYITISLAHRKSWRPYRSIGPITASAAPLALESGGAVLPVLRRPGTRRPTCANA